MDKYKEFSPYKFNSKSGSSLSNFFISTLLIWGVTFVSSEQAYQWYKALDNGDSQLADLILKESNSHRIYKLGKKVKTKPVWNTKKYYVMKNILCEKYDQCEIFRTELDKTKNCILVEDTPNEVWGHGKYGTGRNLLGVLLTEIRHYKQHERSSFR